MINFSMKTFFVLLITTFSCFAGMAQTDESEKRVFNLPPDFGLAEKTNTNIDYSYKLAEIPKEDPLNFKSSDFLRNAPQEKLAYYKQNEPQKLQYFTDAKAFYDNLSSKVKVVFTIEELWYIYYFDQKLKNTLQAVK